MQPFSRVQFRFNRLMAYLMDEMEITWCTGIVILATIYIQTCIKPSGAFLCLSFIKNVH
jgi:hypothetical protein